MKVSDLVEPVIEPVEGRYDRDWLNLNDDRKVRGFDYKSEERREREFVDPDTGETVSERFDNVPSDFDRSAFEEGLVYDPNADGEVEEPTEPPAPPEPTEPDEGDGAP